MSVMNTDTIDKPFFAHISSDKSRLQQAKQLIYFAIAWVSISTILAIAAYNALAYHEIVSWKTLAIPAIGLVLLILAYRHYWQIKTIGQPSVHLAKTSFRPNEVMNGYIEFNQLPFDPSITVSTHVGLIKLNRLALWSTRAATNISEGNRGTRITFKTQLYPMQQEEEINPQKHRWMIYIDLQHGSEQYKYHVPIPVQKNLTLVTEEKQSETA